LEEANLKIEFETFSKIDKEFLNRKATNEESSTYRVFGNLLEIEKANSTEVTPKKDSKNQKAASSKKKKQVKFIDFKANTQKRPRKQLEETVFLPSKQAILTTSPREELESQQDFIEREREFTAIDSKLFTPISMRMTPPSKLQNEEEVLIEEHDETLVEEKRQLRIRSSPFTKGHTRKLENEKEVKKNLNAI
jgi:hypothetical protein